MPVRGQGLLETDVGAEGEVELAGGPAAISGVAQVGPPGGLRAGKRRRIAERVHVRRVHAAHHASPSRNAYGVPAIGIPEVHAHFGDTVHVGRTDDFVAVTTEEAAAVLVRTDEDNVRLLDGA